VLQCPCGGRRRLLAAVVAPSQVEKILRHVRLWTTHDDVIAIRGTPSIASPQPRAIA
jgi:hypothetical protein